MRRLLGVVFALYLFVVGFGVFGPSPDGELERAGAELHKVEREVRSVTGGRAEEEPTADDRRSDKWIFGDLGAEDVGNIALFVPFGAFFPVLWRRWWWLAVPAGVALSGFIELFQLVFLSWRTPSLSDIVWNSLGAVIGFGLWRVWSWSGQRLPNGRRRLRAANGA